MPTYVEINITVVFAVLIYPLVQSISSIQLPYVKLQANYSKAYIHTYIYALKHTYVETIVTIMFVVQNYPLVQNFSPI